MYVYKMTEPNLWTVGFFENGRWHAESDHNSKEEAAQRVMSLNGNSVCINRDSVTYSRFLDIQRAVHDVAVSKGWWKDPADIGRMVCNIHSEISEAWEEFRNCRMDTYVDEKGKPCGFWSEMADAIIRIMDLAEANHVDLEKEILLKNNYNKTREYRHGGKVC